MNSLVSPVSRRSFLAGAAALATPMVVGPSRAAGSNSVTMVGYGGSYQELLVAEVMNPFRKETGIEVKFVNTPELAKIKAMQLMGNVEWDVFASLDTQLASGSRQGFWEKLDPSIFDLQDLSVPPTSDFVAYEISAFGITWDPKKYGPGKHPANFAEYFDLKKFPGRRSFRPYPNGTLEIALLADGVPPKDMYPLDIDRAFRALDRIKSETVWPAATPQSISTVQTGEVDFGVTFINRVKTTTEPGGGVPLDFSFEQNVFTTACLSVIKGAPNKENAMKLVAYMMRPEVQARLQERAGNMPVSKKAAPLLSAEARKWQPNLGSQNSVTVNSEYWADKFEAVSTRFKEWMRT